MLQGIVSDNVLWKVAEDWMWETPLCAAEEALIQKAVDKRKREFRAGRHCAHALLSEAGVQCAAWRVATLSRAVNHCQVP